MAVEFLIRPDLGKNGYRLKCRFKIEAYPTKDRLKQGALQALELFVKDMAREKEKYEYAPKYGIRLNGPFTPVVPRTLRRLHVPSAREMFPAVAQGARFQDSEGSVAQTVTPLAENEAWEYELSAVFVCDTIRFEVPNRQEELEMLKKR